MDPETARIEHLRLIQSVIDRMARNSFAIKAGAITVSAAILAVSWNVSYLVAVLGGIPLVSVLWVLDSFYLRQERAFREFYDQVRRGAPPTFGADSYFSMAAEPDRRFGVRARATMKAMFATSVWILYLVLLLFLVVLAAIAGTLVD